MSRRQTIRPLPRPPVCVEPLEDRRLLSAVVIAPSPPRYAAPAAIHSAVIRPSDDDDDGSGDDDSGGSDAGESAGSTDSGSSDDGSEAGSTTVNDGSSDAGEAAGSSGGGGASSPTDNGDAGGTDDAGGTATITPTSGTTDDNTGDDVGTILYPSGNPYDDDLYDDGGEDTVLVLPTAPDPPNFGGALHIHLPANPVAGTTGVATVDVFNTGGRADGRFQIALGVTPDGSAADAVPVADDTVGVNLGHDRVAAYRVPFTLPATLSPGTYRFLALIDAGNAFAETDEADNVAIGPAVTVAATTPDLSVTTVIAPHTLRADRRVTVTVHLQETGTAALAGQTTLTLTAESADTGVVQQLAVVTRHVKLSHGGRTTVPVRLSAISLPPGTYHLTVTATPASPADTDAADKSATTTSAVSA